MMTTHDHWAVPEHIKQALTLLAARFQQKTGAAIEDLQQFTVTIMKLSDEPEAFKSYVPLWQAFCEKTGAELDDVMAYSSEVLRVFHKYLSEEETVH